MPDPRVLSLDIETYGKHTSFPDQTCFSPRRSLFVDRPPPSRLVLSVALTLPEFDPRCHSQTPSTSPSGPTPASAASPSPTSSATSSTPASETSPPAFSSASSTPTASSSPPLPAWDAHLLSRLSPGPTLTFRLDSPRTCSLLYRWLVHADTIIGMNLQFDLSYLRAFHPLFRAALDGRHTLIDLSVVNYLHCESRPERSLKSLGPVLGTHTYSSDDLVRLSSWSKLLSYNAQDTHNTLLAVAHLARRIASSPPSPKLSPACTSFYSDTIWSCVSMTESGVPFDRHRLLRLFHRLHRHRARCLSLCSSRFSLSLEGDGSQKSRASFLSSLIEAVDAAHPSSPSVRNHPLLTFTEARHDISFTEGNRDLLASLLPPSHPLRRACRLIARHSRASKLIGTYLYPLLFHRTHRKNGDLNRSSILIPQPSAHPLPSLSSILPEAAAPSPSLPRGLNPRVWLSHPTWFIVPSSVKDSFGPSGGTLQARITCKDASHQTDPPPIIACRRSRWEGGHIVAMDLSQIELRVAALLSGEPSLLDAYLKGHDLHGRRALSIWGESAILARYPILSSHPIDKWRDVCPAFSSREGQVGKRTNFADLFRAGPDVMQRSILGDIGEIFPISLFRNIAQSRAHDRPLLWSWQESLIREARDHGCVTLPILGQSRAFLGGQKYDVNEIVNFPVQSTAGNTLLYIQHFMYRFLHGTPTALLFLNVYDALYFDCKTPADVALVRRGLSEAVAFLCSPSGYWHLLSAHYGRSVPLKFGLKVTPSLP